MSQIYNIYCDESRHSNIDQKNMVIGGLWLERNQKNIIDAKLKSIKSKYRIGSEAKWSKVSPSKIDFYIEWVDEFFSSSMEFRCIVIDKERIDYDTHHDGDRELAFYKFYYEMLHQKMEISNTYYLYLDFIQTKRKKRLHDLKEVLNNRFGGRINIRNIQCLDSKHNRLIQLADIFTGAVGYSWNDFARSEAKLSLCKYIAGKVGRKNLAFGSTRYGDKKFNIFKIWLKSNGITEVRG